MDEEVKGGETQEERMVEGKAGKEYKMGGKDQTDQEWKWESDKVRRGVIKKRGSGRIRKEEGRAVEERGRGMLEEGKHKWECYG